MPSKDMCNQRLPILDYTTARPRQWNARRIIGFLLVAAGGMVTLRLWTEIGYRLLLFFGENRAVPGMNHIGDGRFSVLYQWGVVGAVITLAGGLILWQRKMSYFTCGLAVVNLGASISFYYMHRWLILVEYSEWVRMHGP